MSGASHAACQQLGSKHLAIKSYESQVCGAKTRLAADGHVLTLDFDCMVTLCADAPQ
jgi:hypothetical protein